MWNTNRPLVVALGVATVLVLGRSAVFLWWEQAGFDADQAIYGLMAKHIAEGRAFPMFIYGAQYMLAVEAWLAAPLFAVFGPSVGMLKVPVVLVNVATGGLLVWVLHKDGGLKPALAVVASLFYLAASPAMAGRLVETGGGNPEPFLYVLLLWVLRSRPFAFGVVFGIGFLHREFTAYGLTAIVALALINDWRITAERFRAVALAAVGYLIVWQVARTGWLFSTPFGPGAPITAVLGAGDNLEGLAGRFCWAPEAVMPGWIGFFGRDLGVAYGASAGTLLDAGVRSSLTASLPGLAGAWPVFATVLALALGRVLWLSLRNRDPIWRGRTMIGTFLLVVGVQAGVVYIVARCGVYDVQTFRYALLSAYTGIGVVALFLICEPRRVLRLSMAGAVVLWAVASGAGHAQLLSEYIYNEPTNPRRALATYLVANNIRYGWAPYWTAYSTTFLSGERVVLASTDTIRIDDYQKQVAMHLDEAVSIEIEPCRSQAGIETSPGGFWVCRD